MQKYLWGLDPERDSGSTVPAPKRQKFILAFAMLNPDCALDNPKHRISNHPWPLLVKGGENCNLLYINYICDIYNF